MCDCSDNVEKVGLKLDLNNVICSQVMHDLVIVEVYNLPKIL